MIISLMCIFRENLNCHKTGFPFIPDSDQSSSGVDVAITAHHLQPVSAFLLEDVGLGSVIGDLVLELVLGRRCVRLHGSRGRGRAGRLAEPVIVQTPESLGDSLCQVRVTKCSDKKCLPERLSGITRPTPDPQFGCYCGREPAEKAGDQRVGPGRDSERRGWGGQPEQGGGEVIRVVTLSRSQSSGLTLNISAEKSGQGSSSSDCFFRLRTHSSSGQFYTQ